MSSTVLVTGGAGFIGSHLVDRLTNDGAAVRVLDNFSTGLRSNLEGVDASILEADLRDTDAVASAAHGVDMIYHLGALGSVPRSVADPSTTHDVNATGTLNVLNAARAADSRVVIASSSSVFGSNKELPKAEEMPGAPMSPYAVSKSVGEQYARVFADLYDLDVAIVRFFNVFGPRQRADHPYAAVIPRFIDGALATGAVEIHGRGEQRRDFTYIDNVIDGLELLRSSSHEVTRGETFHIACGSSSSLLDVLSCVEAQLGRSVSRTHVDRRAGDVDDSLASIAKMESIGYRPGVLVPEGIELTYKWFLTL